jgi:hypothetical protein
MPEAFKNLINARSVADSARHRLQRSWPGFDTARFEQLAGSGLEELELKARAMQIASAFAGRPGRRRAPQRGQPPERHRGGFELSLRLAG